jgi:RecG-like helicase
MSAEYKLSSDAPHTIIIEGPGSLTPFVEFMDGKIIDTFDGKLCEIPFTTEHALKLRKYLRGRDVEIPLRERTLLKYLADHPEALEDKDLLWSLELTDLREVPAPGKFRKIKTEWELIHYLPLRYLDKTNPQSVSELVEGTWSVVAGTVVVEPEWNAQKDFVKIIVADIKGKRVSATFFRQSWMRYQYKMGDEVILYGTYSEYVNPRTGGRFPQITNAKLDKIGDNLRQNLDMIPIYPQKASDKSWQLQVAQEKLLNRIVWIEDPVPEVILKKHGLTTRNQAYKEIHFPTSRENVEAARRRIAFDEFVRLQVFLARKKSDLESNKSGTKTYQNWAKMFTDSLPFSFTGAQERVIKEICDDLKEEKPMYRLLQGDVGSGKALPRDAKVLTPKGYVAIQDIEKNDLVMTPNGGVTTVIGVFPQNGKRPIYRFTFDDGTTARSDVQHLWSVREAITNEEGNIEFLPNRILTTEKLLANGLKSYRSELWKWHIDLPNYDAIKSVIPSIVLPESTDKKTKAIVSIERIADQHATCIKLLDPAGLFITDDFTITHNTEISSVATLVAVESGYQVALLAPTDILAGQLYQRLSKTFIKAGIEESKLKVAFMNRRVTGKARKALIAEIGAGDVNVIVGTHAILQKDVIFNNLGLVVVDEQHKFGTEQRSALRKVNKNGLTPDMLTMSATPIPRTTSQVAYGDMDISIVDELPAERIPIETEWHETPDYAWAKIREEVEKGQQAYVVASLVEDSDKMENIESAEATYHTLKDSVFPDLRIGLLHGRLSREEKQEVIDRFYANEIQILVATTVVEVGVNVPNATVMTILNANRFGISSLHQIRGRVGRGAIKSYCYLIGEATVPEAEERLNALVESNDGFWLAEKDLEIRGEGSLFGQLQSGANDMFVGNLKEHKDLLDIAKTVAKQAKTSRILNKEIDLLYSGREIQA